MKYMKLNQIAYKVVKDIDGHLMSANPGPLELRRSLARVRTDSVIEYRIGHKAIPRLTGQNPWLYIVPTLRDARAAAIYFNEGAETKILKGWATNVREVRSIHHNGVLPSEFVSRVCDTFFPFELVQ
jgi:hypothetical protein